eukprot:gnl/Trimastix_PCT/1333.p1 GENE.gnl/Trimastix_PCT/1333~~gnl/Trimastix_PCT/1333.p1  ORF type:complete len:221 (+),score=43.01 gnl/Trimastix_PCT/1333:40-702(+)
MSVEFLAVGRLSDRSLLALYKTSRSRISDSQYEETLCKVMSSPRVMENAKMVITSELGVVHYLQDRICIYFAVTPEGFPMRLGFKVLTEMRSQFQAQWSGHISGAAPKSLSRQCKNLFKHLIECYGDASKDKLTAVQSEVDEVQHVMGQNIQKVMERNERIENIETRTDQMRREARQFERGSRQLKRNLWCQKCKLTLIVGTIVLVIIAIIVVVIVVAVQ